MDDLDNYNHVRPDGGPFYTVLGDRLTGYASENLAMVSALSAREAVTVWENSSGHYQNMVKPGDYPLSEWGIARSDQRDCTITARSLRTADADLEECAGACRPFSNRP